MARRRSFALKPDEPVASFALVSTIMPRGAGSKPQTYKAALLIALAVALVCAIFGWMPLAIMVAAFAIPIVYIVYLYDVNLWEDEPIPVTLLAFVLTFVLAIGWTLAWTALRGPLLPSGGLGVGNGPSLTGFLITAILAPLVGEVIRELGPIILARMPRYDDLMDGLTFGVIAGVAYAAGETLVTQWGLFHVGFAGTHVDSLQMASLIFLEGFIKPLVYGTATGLACAEFSGLGRGYDGFTGRYFSAAALAFAAVALYNGGTYLFRFLPEPNLALVLSIIWGVLLLAVLVLRIRTVLHTGLMEAALESAARQGEGDAPAVGQGELDFCPRCEMPLLAHSAFCNACGAATRVGVKQSRGKVDAGVGAHRADGRDSVADESAPNQGERA